MTAAEAQAVQNAAAYGPEWEPYLVERKEVFASDAAGNRLPGAPSTFNESWGIRKKVVDVVPYNGPVPTTEIPLASSQMEESYRARYSKSVVGCPPGAPARPTNRGLKRVRVSYELGVSHRRRLLPRRGLRPARFARRQ